MGPAALVLSIALSLTAPLAADDPETPGLTQQAAAAPLPMPDGRRDLVAVIAGAGTGLVVGCGAPTAVLGGGFATVVGASSTGRSVDSGSDTAATCAGGLFAMTAAAVCGGPFAAGATALGAGLGDVVADGKPSLALLGAVPGVVLGVSSTAMILFAAWSAFDPAHDSVAPNTEMNLALTGVALGIAAGPVTFAGLTAAAVARVLSEEETAE